ncbi:TPA: hypothetical protein ACMDOM_003527, partial [Vibrio cholerae]
FYQKKELRVSVGQWLFIGMMALILIYAFYQMGKAGLDFYKNYPHYKSTFSRLKNFEKHCFKSGLSLFFIVVFLKNSDYAQDYIFQVLGEISTALAGGMFLTGVVAFIRELHSTQNNT